ncbi:EAL domain-containing protein [Methylophaga lonarensis]|uniref:bifunctional diguanylate cyclase/phosphodiesterase n=1 Tax=Methylophaga lonarensis TaxID=999151 RepID=UPI003D28FFA4
MIKSYDANQMKGHTDRPFSTRGIYRCMVAVIGVLLLVGAIYVNHLLQQRHMTSLVTETQQSLSHFHNRLVTNLQGHIQTVRGLPAVFAVKPELTEAEFEVAMAHLFNEPLQLRNIAAAPEMVIRYMYPMQGNEAALGLDYRQVPEQFEAAERARINRELVLAGPLELFQGGVGLITRIPVFLKNEHGEEYFWGLISAVIDAEQFFQASGLIASQMPVEMAIRGKDGLGESGEVFWGDAALFEQPVMLMDLQLPEGHWQLAAQPLGGWELPARTAWQIRVLVFGVALIVFAVFLGFIRFMFAASLANLKFRKLIENSPVPYLMIDRQGHINFANQAFTDSYGYSAEQLVDLNQWWQKTTVSDVCRRLIADWIRSGNTSNSAGTIDNELTITCSNGQTRHALLSTSILKDTHSDELLLVIYDITLRKLAEEQQRFSARVFAQAHEGIMITDVHGVILDVNPAFCEITGYPREEVLGQTPALLKSGKHQPTFYALMWKDIQDQGYWQGEVWNRKKNGELYAELLTISALSDDHDEARHYVGLFSDITQSKQQQETLELMAHYDVLTKLPNRVLFADRFSQALAHSKRTDTWLGVCFLDLDNFKPVNDNYGHEVGDQLLVQVARRLDEIVRDEDTISRFGGDEFAILFRDLESYSQCELMLQRIHHALAKPYFINGQQIEISASSGVALYPQDDSDLDTLLRHADQTMYQAKLTGRNTYRLFNPEQNQQAIERHNLLVRLREALDAGEFELFYQPEVNMKTGAVVGVEALIRWRHPEKGLQAPITFLPALAGSTLENELGDWVIREALQQLQQWQDQGHKLLLSINIAAQHMQSKDFVSNLANRLSQYPKLKAGNVQLEILESSALGDVRAIGQVIKQCEALGVVIALDDFGTGYSSLTHLRHLAAQTIKIDQSFVRDMLDDPHDYTIVDGVIGLAKAFNRQLVAEGVETESHGMMLLMMGCELAQGYGIARPMPAQEVAGWLQNYQPNQQWLAFAAATLSSADRDLQLFQLTTRHWYQQLSQKLSEPKSEAAWPIIHAHECHCGVWLRRAKIEGLFDSDWLHSLKLAHSELHKAAERLKHASLHSDEPLTTRDIQALDDAYQQLNKTLERAVSDPES